MLTQLNNKSNIILPQVLGYCGLIPFIFSIICIIFIPSKSIFFINISFSYGAIILTFVGAIYWGIAIKNSTKKGKVKDVNLMYIWSIIPSLLSLSFFYFSNDYRYLIIIFGYIICQLVDEYFFFLNKTSIWFIKLRRKLSLIVVTTLVYCYINL